METHQTNTLLPSPQSLLRYSHSIFLSLTHVHTQPPSHVPTPLHFLLAADKTFLALPCLPQAHSRSHQAAARLPPQRRRKDSNAFELLRPSSTNLVAKQPEEALMLDNARGQPGSRGRPAFVGTDGCSQHLLRLHPPQPSPLTPSLVPRPRPTTSTLCASSSCL